MAEIIGILAVGFTLGMLVGGAMAYDKGWRAGVSWARHEVFGG